mmetsp:Transcript_1919/g.5094  ORF Transcript_1919/g.5094 Transcript_1919/m.5094 type:complete len:499 (+) Transcript_1919:1392-2888(+)
MIVRSAPSQAQRRDTRSHRSEIAVFRHRLPAQSSDESLAARAEQQREIPEVAPQLRVVFEQAQVPVEILGKSNARIEDLHPPRDSCVLGGQRSFQQRPRHFVDHASLGTIIGEALHRFGGSPHVHEHDRDSESCHGRQHVPVKGPPRHIVHNVRSGPHGSLGDGRVPRVDRNGRFSASLPEGSDDRNRPTDLLLDLDFGRPGPRRFAPNVDDGGTLVDHFQGPRDGSIHPVVAFPPLSAVTEGIGGDVEYSHDEGSIEEQEPLSGERDHADGTGLFLLGTAGVGTHQIVQEIAQGPILGRIFGGSRPDCRMDQVSAGDIDQGSEDKLPFRQAAMRNHQFGCIHNHRSRRRFGFGFRFRVVGVIVVVVVVVVIQQNVQVQGTGPVANLLKVASHVLLDEFQALQQRAWIVVGVQFHGTVPIGRLIGHVHGFRVVQKRGPHQLRRMVRRIGILGSIRIRIRFVYRRKGRIAKQLEARGNVPKGIPLIGSHGQKDPIASST